jgi:GTP cyclohydrolase I
VKVQDGARLTKINGNSDNYSEVLRVIGDAHVATNKDTPLKNGAFELSDEDKVNKIAWHFEEIMDTLGLDLTDDSLKGTPRRVASMFIEEIFSGLDPKNKPEVTLFENKFHYSQMLVEKNIKVHSYCEHHFVPILGKAHVAYIASEHVIGLSKINRIVDYYARRPQVQERLTEQIAEELRSVLHTEDVAVIIEADHMCVAMRGVKDHDSSTTTSSFHGKFKSDNLRREFLTYVFSGSSGKSA